MKKNNDTVCYCNGVSFSKVEHAIQDGHHTLAAIYDHTGAGTGPCGGSCRQAIQDLVQKAQKLAPLSPAALPETPQFLVQAVSLFNRRYYWETHEVLEKVWLQEQGADRHFYQGLIQASAALYHVLNANPKGVVKLAEDAETKLKAFLPSYLGLELEQLCARLPEYAQQARQILGRTRAGFDYDTLPYLLLGQHMEVPSMR